MQPEQPYVSPTGNNYDFIMNPQSPSKPKFSLPGLGNNTFVIKIVAIVVGALVVMAILGFATNLFFGDKTNVSDLVGITQTEQEIVRLSAQANQATEQLVKNAAITTELSITTHQKAWLAFLNTHGRKVPEKELALKKSAAADSKLLAAKQTSTFDETYIAVMRAQLQNYSSALSNAFNHASSSKERVQLSRHYNDVKLLLEQWPE